jgi:hypothetical protein
VDAGNSQQVQRPVHLHNAKGSAVSTDRHHASDENTKARACDAEHAAVWRRAVTEFASPPASFWPASGADPVLSCSPPLPCRPSSHARVTYTDAAGVVAAARAAGSVEGWFRPGSSAMRKRWLSRWPSTATGFLIWFPGTGRRCRAQDPARTTLLLLPRDGPPHITSPASPLRDELIGPRRQPPATGQDIARGLGPKTLRSRPF